MASTVQPFRRNTLGRDVWGMWPEARSRSRGQTLKVGLYSRVSTTRQETDNQTYVLRECCAKSGDTIVREYVEEVSGSGLKKRDEFAAMLQDAKRKKFDLVLFWSLDRFSREGPLKTLQHLELLTNYGVAWKSYTEQYLDSTGIFKDAII